MTLRPLALALLSLTTVSGARAATYQIDPNHTYVMYEIPHFGTSMSRGRFDQKEGTVEFDRAARTGKVNVVFQTGSISTGVAALDKHMQGPDFFDSVNFPTATFAGTKFNFDGDKVSSVDGTLTLHGKTLPVTLKATNFNCYVNQMTKREVCGGNFTTTITRSQFGVNWGLNYGFADQVPLTIGVEAIAQQ